MDNTIAGQYLRLGQAVAAGPDGLRRTYDVPYSAGSVQEFSILSHNLEVLILSRHIQIDAQSLNDIWRRGLNLPVFVSTSNALTAEDQIALFGGRRRRSSLTAKDNGGKEDASRMSTPRKLRGIPIREIFENAATLMDGAPKLLLRETVGWVGLMFGGDELRKSHHIRFCPG